MKKLWKQILVCCLSIAVIASCMPITAAATAVDIYDAASLINALSSGADITLWQDITTSEHLTVAEDSSIDLNGYKLTANYGVTVSAGKVLTVRDSRCLEGTVTCGSLSVSPSLGTAIYLQNGAGLIIESGTVSASGADFWKSGNRIYSCGEGINGFRAFLTVLGGKLIATGGNGKDYRDGTGWRENSPQNACDGILISQMTVDNGEVIATGGNGITNYQPLHGYCGAGIFISDGNLTINGGTVQATGGATESSETEYQKLYGGAGISVPSSSSLAITGGTVTATGAPSGAGIGGCAKHGISAGSVSISGGSVSVAGGEKAFDIGGGYDGSVGTAGSLTVTGGTLKFNTFGRATNVTNPSFQNCTVCGDGAYQHEGTYNADGKLTVQVTDVAADKAAAHAGESIILKAQLTISRTSNITTPAPKGSIVFQRNGEEIGRAAICNPVTGNGHIIAAAETAWVSTGGNHEITAVYVPGGNDRYAPADGTLASAACAVEAHSFYYTVAVTPTAENDGALTGICQKCATETSVTLPHLNTVDYTYQIIKETTCTATGTGRYTWNTTAYGEYDFDIVIPMADHRYASTVTAPTCTEQGYTKYVCEICEDSYIDSYTAALGHDYNYMATTKPTEVSGGVLTGICSRCEDTRTVPLPKLNTTDYTYTVIRAATCAAAGTGRYTWNISTYGIIYFDVTLEKTVHDYSETVTAPTCTQRGYTTHICAVCGDSYNDTYIPALGHSYTYEVSAAPTTTATGSLIGTCRRCDATTTVQLPKLNTDSYTYCVITAATCQATGVGRYTWNTTEYGTYFFDVTIEKSTHVYEEKVTAPTCTGKGYTTHTCARCGNSYIDSYVDALGHMWDNDKVTKEPSCTDNGVKTYSCTRCGTTKTETVEKLGHNYDDKVTAPTCTEKGYTTHTCARCGNSYIDSYVDALGHMWDNDKVTKEPSCTDNGVKTYSCTRCGTTKTETVEKLGHNYDDKVTAPTCTEKGYTTHTCARCGNSYIDSYVDALGHVWDNGTVTTAPTTDKDGVMTYTCSRCGETRNETIPATGGAVDGSCDGGTECPGYRFKDMPDVSNWAHSGIDFAVSHGLFAGTSANTFSPEDSMTRAMMVTVLWRLDGMPKTSGKNFFSDVANGTWFTEAIIWAAENHIVDGVGNGKFEPDGNITREQMATILYRYAVWKNYDTSAKADLSVFPDYRRVSSWAKEALSWANAAELISGTREGNTICLDPSGNATRAQVATIFMRFVNNLVG